MCLWTHEHTPLSMSVCVCRESDILLLNKLAQSLHLYIYETTRISKKLRKKMWGINFEDKLNIPVRMCFCGRIFTYSQMYTPTRTWWVRSCTCILYDAVSPPLWSFPSVVRIIQGICKSALYRFHTHSRLIRKTIWTSYWHYPVRFLSWTFTRYDRKF